MKRLKVIEQRKKDIIVIAILFVQTTVRHTQVKEKKLYWLNEHLQ